MSFLDAFRPEHVRSDFPAIRGDGFDTVCLLLPWHALCPDAASPALDPCFLMCPARSVARLWAQLGGGRWRFGIPIAALDWIACTHALWHGGSRELQIKCLSLHGFVQRLGVRDEWEQAGSQLQAMQTLNQASCRV